MLMIPETLNRKENGIIH